MAHNLTHKSLARWNWFCALLFAAFSALSFFSEIYVTHAREQLAPSIAAAHEKIQSAQDVELLRSLASHCVRLPEATAWSKWLPSGLSGMSIFAALAFIASALWTKEVHNTRRP